jgi:hypothetical protein
MQLQQFLDPPDYATLSHTWNDEEITFQEMLSAGGVSINKPGYQEIKHSCRQTLIDKLELVWVGACLGGQLLHR